MHGFSRTSADFIYFNAALLSEYSLLGVNLFHHGNSTVADYTYDFKLSKFELKRIFDALLQEEGIGDFDVIAYSLGGKIALNLIEFYPERIGFVYLMAADGIKLNAWYNFVSNSRLGEILFLKIIHRPEAFFGLIHVLSFFRILPQRFKRFLIQNLETKELRENVFKTWKSYRLLHPNHMTIKRLVLQYNIQVYALFGKYDLVINYKTGKRFAEKLESCGHFVLLNCAHNVFKHETTDILKELIQKQKG